MEIVLLLLLIFLGVYLVTVFFLNLFIKAIPLWFIFKKLNIDSWKSFIPFYSDYEIIKFCGYNGWFIVLYLIPSINIIFGVFLRVIFARKLGQSYWFAAGLAFLPIVFFPILAIKGFNVSILKCNNCGCEVKGAGIYCVNCGNKL